MHKTSFKETCRNFRTNGWSLNEIAEKTGKSKSTVYTHIRDLKLNPKTKSRWLKLSTARIVAFSKNRKGISALDRHPKPFTEWTPDLVRFVAHLSFDGQITHASCVYSNRSDALIKKFVHVAKIIYDFPPKIIVQDTGVTRVSYHNVELASYLKQKRVALFKNIEKFGVMDRRTFLQTFFDDEGSVYFINKKRMVRGYQHTPQVLRVVHRLLLRFKINSVIDVRHNEIIISGQENLKLFAQHIGFTRGVCVNGNRSNSVWKKSFEKNDILKRALASYRK